jgi:hypothetical protein
MSSDHRRNHILSRIGAVHAELMRMNAAIGKEEYLPQTLAELKTFVMASTTRNSLEKELVRLTQQLGGITSLQSSDSVTTAASEDDVEFILESATSTVATAHASTAWPNTTYRQPTPGAWSKPILPTIITTNLSSVDDRSSVQSRIDGLDTLMSNLMSTREHVFSSLSSLRVSAASRGRRTLTDAELSSRIVEKEKTLALLMSEYGQLVAERESLWARMSQLDEQDLCGAPAEGEHASSAVSAAEFMKVGALDPFGSQYVDEAKKQHVPKAPSPLRQTAAIRSVSGSSENSDVVSYSHVCASMIWGLTDVHSRSPIQLAQPRRPPRLMKGHSCIRRWTK